MNFFVQNIKKDEIEYSAMKNYNSQINNDDIVVKIKLFVAR